MVFQEFLYKQSAPVIATDLEAVSFIFSMHSKYINMNVGNSNNLLRDLSAISSTRNIFWFPATLTKTNYFESASTYAFQLHLFAACFTRNDYILKLEWFLSVGEQIRFQEKVTFAFF